MTQRLWEACNLGLPKEHAAPGDETRSVRRPPSGIGGLQVSGDSQGRERGHSCAGIQPGGRMLRLVNEFRWLPWTTVGVTCLRGGRRQCADYADAVGELLVQQPVLRH